MWEGQITLSKVAKNILTLISEWNTVLISLKSLQVPFKYHLRILEITNLRLGFDLSPHWDVLSKQCNLDKYIFIYYAVEMLR